MRAMTDTATENHFRGLPWRRIAVTLGALAVFRAGLKIPAPGLSVEGLLYSRHRRIITWRDRTPINFRTRPDSRS